MSEGSISIYIKDSDQERKQTARDFAAKITERVGTDQHSDGLSVIWGSTFDSEVTQDIDAFAREIADAGFARIVFHDEYGTEVFWVIDAGKLQKFTLDIDEDFNDPRAVPAYEALNKGLESSWLGGAFSKQDIEAMKARVTAPREKANLLAFIFPAIEIDRRKFEAPEGYRDPDAINVKEDYTDFEWMPMSTKKSKGAEELLEFLLGLGADEIIARTTYGNAPLPYQVYTGGPDGVRKILDSNHFGEDEIDFLKQNTDETIGEFDWEWPSLIQVRELIETIDLEQHANQRLKAYRAQRRHEREARQKLWAQHPGRQSQLVMDKEIYINYVDMTPEERDHLILQLQICGMVLGETGTGFHHGWKSKSIVSSKETRAGAEWLVDNVAELKGYEVVIDPWLDGMAINTY